MENKLIPVEVKKRQSLFRFILNKITTRIVLHDNIGIKKISNEDNELIASIINTALVTYNTNNDVPLNEEELKKIQKRLKKLNTYTYEGDSEKVKKEQEEQEKKLGHKLAIKDIHGYVFTPTNVLFLKEDEWDKWKKGENLEDFTKVIVHEGFHFLTQGFSIKYLTNKAIVEGSDESFCIKTFRDAGYSRVILSPRNGDLLHYNFTSASNYYPAISIMNILGTMVGIKPEVSALKNDGKFEEAVKEKYGKEFYLEMIRMINKQTNIREYNKLENPAKAYKDSLNYVLGEIVNKIIETSKNPEDAVEQLTRFQLAEKWGGRIIFRNKDPKTNKITFMRDNSFEANYRYAFSRVAIRLKERGYSFSEEQLDQCTYKQAKFRPIAPVEYLNIQNGENIFRHKIINIMNFYRMYYGKKSPQEFISSPQLKMYEYCVRKQKERIRQKQRHRLDRMKVKNTEQTKAKITRIESERIRVSNMQRQQDTLPDSIPVINPNNNRQSSIPTINPNNNQKKSNNKDDDNKLLFGDF